MSTNDIIIKTPIGNLLLSECDGFITQCRFTNNSTHTTKLSPILKRAVNQLQQYFSGQRTEFDLPLATTGTSFQKNVWLALQTIPYGKTWSYQQLAQHLNSPKASRAVGTANAKNTICIIIPCHRVILATGATGDYAGGKDRKIKLLTLEQQ